MFLDDPKARKALTKWAVGTVAACILIFLGVRYISSIALAIEWLVSLVKPLLIGAMLAMILSVPLDFIEKHLFRRKSTPSKEKARRPVAILLSLLLVIGIFAGIAVLVIPELTGAISIVVSSITGAMEQLALLDSSADLSQFPFAQQLSVLDIDWLSLKAQLENWIQSISTMILDSTAHCFCYASRTDRRSATFLCTDQVQPYQEFSVTDCGGWIEAHNRAWFEAFPCVAAYQ